MDSFQQKQQALIVAKKQNRVAQIKLEQARRKRVLKDRASALSTLLHKILPLSLDVINHITSYMSFKIPVSIQNMECNCLKCRNRLKATIGL